MTGNTTDKILYVLKKQKKEEGKLPLLLEFYQDILKTQNKAKKSIGVIEPTISEDAILARHEKGLPLVAFDELAIDWAMLKKMFTEIIAVFGKYPELFGEIPDYLKAPNAGRLLTKKAVKAWYSGKELPPSLLKDIDENLIQAIIQSTMQPFLAAHAQTLINSVKHEHWSRGYCPICGGIPDMAYLEKEVGARWLLCTRCDSEWLFHRVECPHCNTQDRTMLSFLSDEKGLYRLYLCEKCKCYIKEIDLRKTETEVLMPLERINTLDLDTQARERGYQSHH